MLKGEEKWEMENGKFFSAVICHFPFPIAVSIFI